MKKLILPITILILSTSCSHMGSLRTPASGDGNCFSILGEIYDETSPSHRALNELDSLEVELEDAQKTLDFEEFLGDLHGKILTFDDPKLQEAWVSLMSSFQQYKYSGSPFESFKTNWESYKKTFFQKWREAEKAQLIKKTQEITKLEEEAQSVVKELKNEEIEAMELVNRRTAIIQGVWAKLRSSDADINGELKKEELTDFTYWLFAKADLDQVEGTHVYDSINHWLKEYRDVAKHMSKSTRKNMIIEGKKNLLTLYNQVTIKSIDELTSVDELRKQSFIHLELFSLLEPRFNQDGFSKYLLENDFFSEESLQYYRGVRNAEGIDIDLGMMLRDRYQRFAPYQDRPPVVNQSFAEVTVQRTRDLWDKLSKGQKSCSDLDCYNKQARNGWLGIFSSRPYKNAFSCMRNNPVVLKSMVMDLALVWGGLTWYYMQNQESFQRFPLEIMINGAAFAPIMAEANCRSTFKGNLAFGTQIPEKEVITNALTKTNRAFKTLRGVAFKGFLSSVGLLSLTSGFDHLFLALGHQVASPLSLNDMATLLPISFLYHGVWLGVKNMAVMNPIRHKVIPRLAQAIAKKTGLNKAYWPLQTGLDFGAYHAFATLGRWDYMIFYSAVLLPFVHEHFSVGTDLEHKQELIKENVVEHTFQGVSESGVETEVVIVEDKSARPEAGVIVMNDEDSAQMPIGGEVADEFPKGTVQVKSVDVKVTDDVIDSWADKILSGLPQD